MARRWNKTFARADQRDMKQSISCQEKDISEEKINEKRTLDKTEALERYSRAKHYQRTGEEGEVRGEELCEGNMGRQGPCCKVIK